MAVDEAAERAAFEAHVKGQLKADRLYNNPNGHRLVDLMVKVIPAEIDGHKQNRAGQYVEKWVETLWRGWRDRAAHGVPPSRHQVQAPRGTDDV